MRIRFLSILVTLAIVLPTSAEVIELPAFASANVGPFTLSFEDLLQESRCPIGVTCFWEGDGVIQLGIAPDSGDAQSFELHTHSSFGSAVEYDGYIFALLELDPYPVVDVLPVPEDYVATLSVEAFVLPGEESSWSKVKALY